jgi:alkyl hydroperoxide reductase 1
MCRPSSISEFGFTAAYQPTCHANHLPPYLKKYEEFKAKGVDVIAVIAANDPFVMSGWGRFEGLEDKVRGAATLSSSRLSITCPMRPF